MKNTILLSLCLFLGVLSTVFAQKKVADIPVPNFYGQESIYVQSSDGKKFLVLLDKKEWIIVELDEEMQKKSLFRLPVTKGFKQRKENSEIKAAHWSNKNVLGSIANEQFIILFYYTDVPSSIQVVKIDYINQGSVIVDDALELIKDSFVDAYEHNHTFYILTTKPKSKEVEVYSYTLAAEAFHKYSFDFQPLGMPLDIHTRFTSPKGEENSLWRMVSEVEYSLGNTFHKHKYYTQDHTIIFTLEKDDCTHVLTLDLNTAKPAYFPAMQCLRDTASGINRFKANSFIYSNYLYQVSVTPDSLAMQIYDLNTRSVVRTFKEAQANPISFANTPIFEERSAVLHVSSDRAAPSRASAGSIEVTDDTGMLLRKMLSTAVAIAVSKYNEHTLMVEMGSYQEKQAKSGTVPLMGGLPVGSIAGVGIYISPLRRSYMHSGSRKSTYFRSLLSDTTFQHQEGQAQRKLIFDKIRDTEEKLKLKENLVAENLFKVDESCIFGFYNTETRSYILMKFE